MLWLSFAPHEAQKAGFSASPTGAKTSSHPILASTRAWLGFVTVVSFCIDYDARREERAARVEEVEFRKLAQAATAWELFLTRAGGDVENGIAIDTILTAQGQLTGGTSTTEALIAWTQATMRNYAFT